MDFEFTIKLNDKDLGERIKKLIKDRRLKQKDIALACGVHSSRLTRLFRGQEGINGEIFVKMYKELYNQSIGRTDDLEFLLGYIPPNALDDNLRNREENKHYCFCYYVY